MPGLFDLPPELLDIIYYNALLRDTGYPIAHDNYYQDSDNDTWHSEQVARDSAQPPLTETCKAVRKATLPIFYGINQLIIKAWNDNDGLIAHRWLTAIGSENRSMLRCMLAVGGRRYCYDTEHGVPVLFEICAGLGEIEVVEKEWGMYYSSLPVEEDTVRLVRFKDAKDAVPSGTKRDPDRQIKGWTIDGREDE